MYLFLYYKYITKIGKKAFGFCINLKSVKINNPESVLDKEFVPTNVTIYGYADSTAFEYAQNNGNDFVLIASIGDVDGDGVVTIKDAT